MSIAALRSELRRPNIAAAMLVLGTLPLIFMGGLVTTTGVGMSVPDWPTTFGHNMVAAPPSVWWNDAGTRTEHLHRLLGMAVGILAIHLVVATFLREPRRWVRRFALAVLFGVIGQGVLGGYRVRLGEQLLAFLHGCTAQLFLGALAMPMVAFTSRGWREAAPAAPSASVGTARGFAIALALVTYGQVVVGAVVRHFGSLVHLHMTLGAAVLALAILAGRAAKKTGRAEVARASKRVHMMVGIQILLGVVAYLAKTGEWASIDLRIALATSHVVVGAFTFASTTALALATFRHVRPVVAREEVHA
jgi:cytochrome c oxidase assembly protein subunit 15